MRIEVLVDVKTTLGEGPLWDVEQERLYWIDSFDGRVFRATAAGSEIRCWDVPQKIGSMALRKDGAGAVVSLARGFHLLDFKTGDVELIVDPEPGKSQQPAQRRQGRQARPLRRRLDGHDGGRAERRALSSRSRLLAAQARRRNHRLQRPVLESRTARPSISPTPGPARSGPTTTTSRPGRRPTGAPSSRSTRSRGGAADGSTVDAEGCLWNALVYDGRLVRYDPTGRVDRVIDMPVKKVTSVMFGGPKLGYSLRHLDGQATAAALSRRRVAARQSVRDLRSRDQRRCRSRVSAPSAVRSIENRWRVSSRPSWRRTMHNSYFERSHNGDLASDEAPSGLFCSAKPFRLLVCLRTLCRPCPSPAPSQFFLANRIAVMFRKSEMTKVHLRMLRLVVV